MTDPPFVSIIVPCRNEERFIGRCLDSILANDYPAHRLEVLVVDGMSEDRSRDIVTCYAARHACVRLVSNPTRVTPAALNRGIRQARGEIIIRMDAHAECPPHYVSVCVAHLDRLPVDVVGGPVVTMPASDGVMARSIALAIAHPFGVGNSRFRTSVEAGYVDTVPFGACRADLFQRHGLFDERLVRNQDNELNSRIIAAGGKIYLAPELAARYYAQGTVGGLLRQAWRTGMWNVLTVWLHPRSFRWRHFVPWGFVTAASVLALLASVHPGARVGLLLLAVAYGLGALVSSLQVGLREGLRYVPVLPPLFLAYHLSYGLGTWIGGVRTALSRRGWSVGPTQPGGGEPDPEPVPPLRGRPTGQGPVKKPAG